MTIALAILGASGKMGKRVLQLAGQDAHFHIIGLGSRSNCFEQPVNRSGDCIEDVLLTSDPKAAIAKCDVAIDFTSHEATWDHLKAAMLAKKALVIGTTGHAQETIKAIEEAAKTIPILFSPNFSFGIALCLETARSLGRRLFGKCTIDILESHHVYKQDRPSGTALALANCIENGRVVLECNSAQPRKEEEIVIHSIRSGEAIGEHTIIFECGHERIELKHTAHSRDAFAHGALMGAKFLVKQRPGLYSLQDLYRDKPAGR